MQINRWAPALCAAILFCAATLRAPAAQFTPGDILVSDFEANHVQEFSPSGTLVRTYQPTGTETVGIDVANGKLFVVNRNSSSTQNIGTVNAFSPDGTITSTFSIPQIGYAYDITSFPDGVFAVTGIDSPMAEYTQSGAFIRTIPLSGDFFQGDTVATADGSLWVTAETSKIVYHLSETGSLLGSFTTPFEPSTLQVAPNGTLWIGGLFDSHIYHYTTTGSQLGTITTSLRSTEAIALSPNGSTLYATYEGASLIASYTTTGQSLGTFTVPGAQDLAYLTVIPEPTSLTILTAAAVMILRRRR